MIRAVSYPHFSWLVMALIGFQAAAVAQGDTGELAWVSSADRKALVSCGIREDEVDRLLALSVDAFDQDLNGGWRAVSQQPDCDGAARVLIEQYIRFSTKPDKDALRILRFHAGQLAANEGREMLAVRYFQQTMQSGARQRAWNLYVSSTIAFLERDRERLEALRDELANVPVSAAEKASRRRFLEQNPGVKMYDGYVDQPMNLTVVDKLLRCFDQPYRSAYAGKC